MEATPMKKKVLLAYSGGLDTSAIIPWLIENHNAEVIAYCSDLGNSPDEKEIGQRAKDLGAVEFIFEDVQKQFAADFVFPMARAGAVYQEEYLLGTAIARPLIGERTALWAQKLGATAIAHGATGKGNDQIRFERAWAYLAPQLEVITPWKVWDFKSRTDLQNYLNAKGYPITAEQKEYSVDVNLMHRSCEGGILEQIGESYPVDKVLSWTAQPGAEQQAPTDITLTFKNGIAVALNGKAMDAHLLLGELNRVGGLHGIGMLDLVEERTNGMKSRGIYETPGGTILYAAIRCLKQICWSRSLHDIATLLAARYATLVYDGLWHSDARLAAEAFFENAASTLEGTVTLRLAGSRIFVLKRDSAYSLFDRSIVSFEEDTHAINNSAIGYVKTLCIPLRQAGRVRQKSA
jgi:argininosuccinate synthase